MDELRGGRQVRTRLAVGVEVGDPRPDPPVGLGHTGAGLCSRRRRQIESEVERLGANDELDADDFLDVLEHGSAVPGRDRAHRDVILLVGARRNRIGGCRMDEDLVLRREGGRGVLVDHHPRVDAGRRSEEGRKAAVQSGVKEKGGPSFADRAELGDRELGEIEGQRDRLAMKVAAADHHPATGREGVLGDDAALREDEWVVRG
jgi:hypothetical protein